MNRIMAVKINGRTANAPLVQEILTKYGCNIKTRIGFHETNEDQCSTDGILILQLFGKDDELQAFLSELGKLNGVSPKFIEF
ncbi:MAG: hypothetical protein ACM3ZR_09985 [Pseudomonadota bacterium]